MWAFKRILMMKDAEKRQSNFYPIGDVGFVKVTRRVPYTLRLIAEDEWERRCTVSALRLSRCWHAG